MRHPAKGYKKNANFETEGLKSVMWRGMFPDLSIVSERTCYKEYEQYTVVISGSVSQRVWKKARYSERWWRDSNVCLKGPKIAIDYSGRKPGRYVEILAFTPVTMIDQASKVLEQSSEHLWGHKMVVSSREHCSNSVLFKT